MKRQTRSAAQNGFEAHTNGVSDVSSNGVMSNKVKQSNGNLSPSAPAPCSGGSSLLYGLIVHTLLPLALMLWSSNMPILFWYTMVKCEGSYQTMLYKLWEGGVVSSVINIWSEVNVFSLLSVSVILGYCAFALVLMVLLPGPRAEGPVTPKGNVPVYRDNGFFCYVVSMVVFFALALVLKMNGASVTIVYDRFDEFIATMTSFTIIFCLLLTFKGLYAPSTSDCGTNNNFIMDFYWGTELYPRIFGIDVKVFTNCRFGLTIWPIFVMLFSFKSYELHGFVDSIWVSCVLQMIYLTKFFWWEAGYMRTIDIMVDRAGYYICWGCLCFVPFMYTSVSFYLVSNPVRLGPVWSAVILLGGLVSVAINYIADKQKQDVRESKGQCLIWGREPKVIRAKYQLESGETRESLLLVSGWWGVARHFHYVPELLLAFFWSVPGLFENLSVYSYLIILAGILIHRTFRDDAKCGDKYKQHWDEYRRLVPYKMIPGIF